MQTSTASSFLLDACTRGELQTSFCDDWKRGLRQMHYTTASMTVITCISFLSAENIILNFKNDQ